MVHEYPDRKVGPLGLAKHNGTNVVSLALTIPMQFAKSLVGLVSIPDRYPQHPRFRGEEFVWYEERCTGCAILRQVLPPGHH